LKELEWIQKYRGEEKKEKVNMNIREVDNKRKIWSLEKKLGKKQKEKIVRRKRRMLYSFKTKEGQWDVASDERAIEKLQALNAAKPMWWAPLMGPLPSSHGKGVYTSLVMLPICAASDPLTPIKSASIVVGIPWDVKVLARFPPKEKTRRSPWDVTGTAHSPLTGRMLEMHIVAWTACDWLTAWMSMSIS